MEHSADPDEAAAIAAAIEQFVAETVPAPRSAEVVGPWTRAALLEGVGAKRAIKDLEGGMR
jgi:hypothetical protein